MIALLPSSPLPFDDDRPEWRRRLEIDDPEAFVAWMVAETRLLDALDKDEDPWRGLE